MINHAEDHIFHNLYIGAVLYQVELYHREKQAKLEAERANRLKSEVLSFVSHDFKNPLVGIQRIVEVLMEDKMDILSEKHRELLGYIEEGSTHLSRMVFNILNKARLEEGRITPNPRGIEIKSFIDSLMPTFNAMAVQQNIQVHIEIQPELISIRMDPTHLRQILINL